jgi:hypothetical protein
LQVVNDLPKDDATKKKSSLTDGENENDTSTLEQKDQDYDLQSALKYKASPTTLQSSTKANNVAPCASPSKSASCLLSLKDGSDNDGETFSKGGTLDDELYHPSSLTQGPTTPLGGSQSGSSFRASNGDPTLQFDSEAQFVRRSIYHPHHHYQQKAKGVKDHQSGEREKMAESMPRQKKLKHAKNKVSVFVWAD